MARRLSVRQTRFHNPRLRGVGVEVLTLAELRARAGASLPLPERLEFHLLLMIESGTGIHRVDFRTLPLRTGSLVFVRLGQVQQWGTASTAQGTLVLISPEALAPSARRGHGDLGLLTLDEWPQHTTAEPALFEETAKDVRRLRADIERFSGAALETAIIHHTLYALLLRLARDLRVHDDSFGRSREAEIHLRYTRRLESDFHKRLSVLDYARALACSESTLSRACLAVTGQTAKALLDQRIALEAKRLLAHSPAAVAQIGYQLGFSEPTNFVKFFRRLEHLTPEAFRRQLRD